MLAERRITEPTACITFDDGYRNNESVAFPILKRLGLPSTIYLATGLIGTNRLLWTTEVSLAVQNGACDSMDLSKWGGRSLDRSASLSRAARATELVEFLKLQSASTRRQILSEIDLSLAKHAADYKEFLLMSWSSVRSLAASGLVSFGGHTINHEIVSRLSDESLALELEGSVKAISRELGERHKEAVSRSFAYPNGREIDFDMRAVSQLRELGISSAVTTIGGVNRGHANLYMLKRLVVGPHLPLNRFAWTASGMPSKVARVLGAISS